MFLTKSNFRKNRVTRGDEMTDSIESRIVCASTGMYVVQCVINIYRIRDRENRILFFNCFLMVY